MKEFVHQRVQIVPGNPFHCRNTHGVTESEHRAIYSALTAALENGTFNPFVGLELPLADAPKSHTEVMEGESHGKIVLIP